MKVKTKAGEAEFSILPKGSKKSEDLIYKITTGLILIVIAYVLYQLYKGYNAIKSIPENLAALPGEIKTAAIKTYTDTGGAIALAAGRTPEEYFTFVNEQPLPAEIAIKAGDVILESIGLGSILTDAATAGKTEGQNLNDCRGVLSIANTAEYGKLTTEQHLSYNMWACNYNKTHGIDITTFHYAPDIALWKADTGIQKSFDDIIGSWFTW